MNTTKQLTFDGDKPLPEQIDNCLFIQVEPFNPKRFSKPWARNLSIKCWGEFTGSPQEGGHIKIHAEPGHVIMHGIKDKRIGRSRSKYCICMKDYSIVGLSMQEAHCLLYRHDDKPET